MKRIEKLTAEHLAIYLGHNVDIQDRNSIFNLDDFYNHVLPEEFHEEFGAIGFEQLLYDDLLRLVLRTRQSITPEELETFSICFRMWYDKPDFDYNLMVYSDIVQMAKLHIDIFGLIESGLAVDKETIKKL